ncbi:MAG: ABC transporter ATP-binding protein [Acidobacteria bacterium]|nr:ABC transporter ATP-binding protein [Acidobacteriota bacterium]
MSARPTPRQRIQAAFRLGRALHLVWQTAPRWTLANAALVVVQGGLPLAALYVMKRILDAVSATVGAPGRPELVHGVFLWILIAAGVALLTALTRLLTEYATEAQSLQVTDAVAEILHAQSIAVDLAYYEDPSYYDTLHRAQGEAPYRPSRIVNGLIQIAQNGLALAGIAAWLISLNWLLAAALFIGVLPGAFARLMYSRRLFGLQQAQTEQERRAWYYHTVMTEMRHAKELRIFDLGALFRSRYQDLRRAIRTGTLTLARYRIVTDLFAQIVAIAALFGSLAWIALQTIRGAVTLGDLAVYYIGFQTGLSLLQAVLRSLAGLYEDNLFLTNLYRFLDLVPNVAAPHQPKAVPEPMTRGISFHDVAFRYPSHASDTLEHIDVTVAPGEVVALVGENGSGKTTLIKLLCRLYDPTRGAVTVDGIDLRDLDPVQWRRQISAAFQDYAHYALTAKENIWLGDVATPPDAVRIAEVGRRSGADSVVGRLPLGYDTLLGRWFREGQELSEGEWQRIAMGRAFWRDARVLILDEPSSALDPLAEAELLGQFRELLGGRSAIIISHRLSTVQMADCIYVMDQGRIVEKGRHAVLLESNGHYARLYRAQAQHYRDQ